MMNAEIANEMTRSRNHADINAVERREVFGGAATSAVGWEISGPADISVCILLDWMRGV